MVGICTDLIKCYQIVLNIRADRHLYGHLNHHSGFLCRKCWLGCGGSDFEKLVGGGQSHN